MPTPGLQSGSNFTVLTRSLPTLPTQTNPEPRNHAVPVARAAYIGLWAQGLRYHKSTWAAAADSTPAAPCRRRTTHCLVIAYRVDLGAEHDCSEGEEQEALKAQEDQQDYSYGRREVAALCRREGGTQCATVLFYRGRARPCLAHSLPIPASRQSSLSSPQVP